MSASFRLELFVDALPASLDFYERVLGFEKQGERPGGYTPLIKGAVRLALNLKAELSEDHPIRTAAHERPGLGVEIVLEVDDTDFRVVDPDGYYWRGTSRA